MLRRILALAVIAGLAAIPTTAAQANVDGLPSCGVRSFSSNGNYPAGRYLVGATVSCKQANNTLRIFLRGGGRLHMGTSMADTWTTVGRWRCGYSTASAGCTTRGGERLVAYLRR